MCATPYATCQLPLQALADADPALLGRIERANGKKYLRKVELPAALDTMPQGSTPEPATAGLAEGQPEGVEVS